MCERFSVSCAPDEMEETERSERLCKRVPEGRNSHCNFYQLVS